MTLGELLSSCTLRGTIEIKVNNLSIFGTVNEIRDNCNIVKVLDLHIEKMYGGNEIIVIKLKEDRI